MATPKYNAAVKIGEYKNAAGETKNRYLRIGRVMEGEKGVFLLLDAAFISMQLFALANKERRDSIIVGLFEEKTRESVQGAGAQPSNDGDIPF